MNRTLAMCLAIVAVVASNRAACAWTDPPAPMSTVLAAAEAGITPTSLTVIGIASGGSEGPLTVQTILDRIGDAVELRQSLAIAHFAFAAASAARAEAASLLFVESDHSELLAQFQQASLEMEARQQQIEVIHAALRESALDGISPEQIARVAAWTGTARFAVPPEFRILEFSSDHWAAVAAAIRAEARAMRSGEPLAPEHATLLDQIRYHAAVIEAGFNLLATLEDVEAVFEQFSES